MSVLQLVMANTAKSLVRMKSLLVAALAPCLAGGLVLVCVD